MWHCAFEICIYESLIIALQLWYVHILLQKLGQNPRTVGQAVLDATDKSPLIAKLECSGPGFINITLSQLFIREQVRIVIYYPPALISLVLSAIA